MRLTFSTDYALRLLTLVGLEIDRLLTIEEVADRSGISNNHLLAIWSCLCHLLEIAFASKSAE
jgi:Rrf2 family nitric oxide-sensitive transcriptional repressor